MSKKGNKKTANKSLETLKRKQYARGGKGATPAPVPLRKPAPKVPASDVPAFDPRRNSGIAGGMQLGQPQGGLVGDMRYRGGPTQEQKNTLLGQAQAQQQPSFNTQQPGIANLVVGSQIQRGQNLKAAGQAPDIQGAETGMPGSFGYLSPEEKSRREKGYQDRMARQQKLMDENPLVPQIQNLDAQVLGGPNDPLSENYIDPRIEMREIKRQQQAQYDASDEARQRNMANQRLMLNQRTLEQNFPQQRSPSRPYVSEYERLRERPQHLRGIGSIGR